MDIGGPLKFVRYYSSSGFYTLLGNERSFDVLGVNWRHSWQSAIVVEPSQGAGQNPYGYVVQPDGDYRHFQLSNGVWVGRADKPESLQEIVVGGTRTGWVFTAANDSIYRYDANGTWLSLEEGGLVTTLTYSDASTPVAVAPKPGLLISVTDARGRSLEFRYDAQGFLIEVADAAGEIFGYRYAMQQDVGVPAQNKGLLLFADRPDSSSREYRYDEAAHVASSPYVNLLTGIVDENGERYGTYNYDASGRAFQEYHGTGANLLTLTYSGSYNAATSSTIVVDALGQIQRRRFVAVNGVVRDAGRDRCADAACNTVTSSTNNTYSSDGNRNLVTDFNGSVTDHDYNSRGLETQRLDDVRVTTPPSQCPASTTYYASNYSSSCTAGTCWATQPFAGSQSATPLGYPGWQYSCTLTATTNVLRKVLTTWHPSFNQPTERALKNAQNQTESLSRWALNARGQVTARCDIDPADTSAVAYSCSATTAPPAGAKVRRWVYEYCEASDVAVPGSTCPLVGLVKSVNGPRATTDAGIGGLDDVTTYAYYANTDESGCATVGGVCHRKGDLWKTTNALGHVVENVTYDWSGRVTRSKDANGTITDLAYHARGWLLTRTVRANANGSASTDDATTTFTYNATGNVTRVTQPDGAYLNYTYDAALRLTDVVDNLGNRLHYTLDGAGNRIKEEAYDASYNPATPAVGLKRSMSRVYNQLSRLTKTLNASLAPTRNSEPFDSNGLADGYDANGNVVLSQDGLGTQTQQTYDPLNRLTQTMQDYLGTSPETANATLQYTYDARDNLRTVTDPDSLTTTYTYDGLSNLTDLDSPDTGHTDYAYDLAGNRTSQTDNRGVTSTYAYDASYNPATPAVGLKRSMSRV
ncbi:MAG TPA: hypothetical protein VM555_06185, partial [Tahibacter sp.]|nr:hypothetical protein [Tahibacter sp.]